jgi:hypothetical protein
MMAAGTARGGFDAMRYTWLLVTSVSLCAPCLAQDSAVLAPDAMVDGRSQAEWSRRWWQWAGSFDNGDSPVADRTGRRCGLKQHGPVWFLAGTYGSHRVIRTCTVPHGRYVFFPLIHYVVMPDRADARLSCEQAVRTAREITDGAELVLDVDGRRVTGLARHRQASPACFDMGELTQPRFRVFPSASDGYYVMLAPLAPGKHSLNYGGMLPSMSQAVTYHLLVE